MQVLDNPTPNLFFTGKGGVGKTSLSCATAVALADAGKTILLVSTDPASNIDEVLGAHVDTKPCSIAEVPNLSALNVDPEKAAEEYRERVIGPYRGVLPEAAVKAVEEQFAGACTVEIAAFDEFAKLLANDGITNDFDHIVFDTAPTGHTLRLLSLPTAWTGFIEDSSAGTSCLGPLEGLKAQRALYETAVKVLSNEEDTTLVLVSRAERSELDEAERTSKELAQIGLRNQALAINGVFKAIDPQDTVAVAMELRCQQALSDVPEALSTLPRRELPLKSGQVIGVPALRKLFAAEDLPAIEGSDINSKLPPNINCIIEDLTQQGHGVVMTMGKGGVGKTTVAAHIAVELAKRGHKVHLSTTDPAAHVANTVDDIPNGLEIDRIDPEIEVARYREKVLSTTGTNLDEAGLALLEEDLSSPCTEEIAVFEAFARTVDTANDQIVVLDTAPTGHTILLLDAAESYHREVSRLTTGVPEAVANLLPRLRDPAFTRVIICALAEATPVHEAADLQRDLSRADIRTYAWIINQSLAPLLISDPVLRARRAQENRYIKEVIEEHARDAQIAIVPWQTEANLSQIAAPTSDAA